LLHKSTRFHDKDTLDHKYETDLLDYKKIGVVLKNRWVFEHYMYLFVSDQMALRTHAQTIILLRLKIFQCGLKRNTFTTWYITTQGKKTNHTFTPLLLTNSLCAEMRNLRKWKCGAYI